MDITLETVSAQKLTREQISPAIDELDSAIQRLDGQHATLLIMDSGKNKLFIGGGPVVYSVSLQLGDNDFYNLKSGALRDGRQAVTLGGQSVDFPRRLLVSREEATHAAREFLSTGEAILKNRNWEPSGPELEPTS